MIARPPRRRARARAAMGVAIALAIGAASPARADPAPDGADGDRDTAGAERDRKAALVKLRRGAHAEAEALLRRALEKSPASAVITNDLGFVLARAGATVEAERLYRRAIALDVRRVYAYVNLADLVARSPDRWHRRGEIVALLAKGQAALADDVRGRLKLRLALADFERRVGRLAEARRALEPAGAAAAPAGLRKRALDLGAAIAADEAAQGMDDWPEPPLSPGDQAAIARAEALLAGGRSAAALEALAAFAARPTTPSVVRYVRARALETLGRYDEAQSELAILLQVRPTHARGWRLLGSILAQHGGTLEAERADEALRRALALEPSWDDLRALRRLVAEKRRRAGGQHAAGGARVAPPSRKAVALFDEAERWLALDTPEMAEAALREALREAPGFVDAAVSLFAVAHEIPDEVAEAIWDDGEALARLAAQLLGLRKDDGVVALVRPWLERAVELGSSEARFQRALLRADAGDRAGALADLASYVGGEVSPPRLSEARALRVSLLGAAGADTADTDAETAADAGSGKGGGRERGRRAALEQARRHLLADRPADAERALGGPCRPGIDPPLLVELGRVHEYAGASAEALGCYRLAAAAVATDGAPDEAAVGGRRRLARLVARLGPQQAAAVEGDLVAARRAGVPEAALALADLARVRDRADEALAGYAEYLAHAEADDPIRAEAAERSARLASHEAALGKQRAEKRRLLSGGAAAAGVLLLAGVLGVVLRRRFRGASVERALRRHPELHPEVARAVAEIRHDVLKHRASALGLAASGGPRDEVARALLEPAPASAAVAEEYERLRGAAAALGVVLRAAAREPTFGPLIRDLARAESLVVGPGGEGEIGELDRALRERHPAALARLLGAGPRTRLDPARLSMWIRAVEAEQRALLAAGAAEASGWTAPELHLQEIDIELPVTEPVVATVLANLLRNAAAAVRGSGGARIVVRVGEERDASGRRLAMLLVADSAEKLVTADEIAHRPPDRGLGIVRELVRRWGGHLVVRAQTAPLTKAIGAAFPVAPPATTAPEATR